MTDTVRGTANAPDFSVKNVQYCSECKTVLANNPSTTSLCPTCKLPTEERQLVKPQIGEASFLLDRVSEWIKNQRRTTHVVKFAAARRLGGESRPRRNPPCIEAFLKEGFTKRLEGHRNQIVFAVLNGIRRLNFAITPEELAEVNARSERPLPERELHYQISYLLNRPSPYSFRCEIMQNAGLCPAEKCPIGRSTPKA